MSSHIPTFSGIDSSYSLPDNVAIITLQVDGFPYMGKGNTSLSISLLYFYFNEIKARNDKLSLELAI